MKSDFGDGVEERARRRRQALLGTVTGAVGVDADESEETATGAARPLIGDRVLQKYENRGIVLGGFDRYMQKAQSSMQQGQYYRAAESYGMASLYRPGDAEAHLGKSLALLAAGEYVSSALSLARAIELNPQRALRPSDLVGAVGGPVAFERRVADLEECLRDNNTAQLHFLLAYVYQQTGQSQEAQNAIDAAHRQLPSSTAVDLLKTALAR